MQPVALRLLTVHSEAWQVDFVFGIAHFNTQRSVNRLGHTLT